MFYAFSIVVLMVKYIRREREEANLRNYYYEFVSREKFRSAQFRNRQIMNRLFCRGSQTDQHTGPNEREDGEGTVCEVNSTANHSNQTPPTARNDSCHNQSQATVRLGGNSEVCLNKDSFPFLGVRNQICRNGFFGKKFCNKQLCSKCVSESAPTIDWDDGRSGVSSDKHKQGIGDFVEVRLSNSQYAIPGTSSKGNNHKDSYSSKGINHKDYLLERFNSVSYPILECDSDVENEDDCKQQHIQTKWRNEDVLIHTNYDAVPEHRAIVSSCSLEVSNLLANLPPLDIASNSNDMDTLDGLSNLDSEAGSQSLLNYSASIRGTNSVCGGQSKESPGLMNRSASGDDRLKDLSDFLSERTSLLSCTLSIDDGDEDAMTNVSSSKHHPCGLSLRSSSNGKVKEDVRSNGKSILNSLSKSLSSDEGERKKFLNDITNLTEESRVFKNLKYFLRGFSKDGGVKEAYETLNLLPRETFFGPGSPQSYFGDTYNVLGPPTKLDTISTYRKMDTVDNLLNIGESDISGNHWDSEDELYSVGDRSSSFGDYWMGEASESQVIDISQPLVKRQLDSTTENILSRAITGIVEPQTDAAGQIEHVGAAAPEATRKETKV
ncbi:unnamed protein product [Candidula unifasciata]|uniref:Uncharacterized protein n=1 Tax=Candidula unifasciata TaxID=100452 RepID=A0A8S3Z952_9EUPU|nr:unnamed protein product [Candidula unifasciata]